jgi:hypothetical protein
MSRPELRVVQAQQEASAAVERDAATLQSGDGGGTSDGMDQRVTRLEEWAKLSDQRMGRVEDKLDGLGTTLADMRAHMLTRGDIADERRQQTATAWAIAGVIVGLVSAVIAWTQLRQAERPTSPANPAPIIIHVPAAVPPPALPKPK